MHLKTDFTFMNTDGTIRTRLALTDPKLKKTMTIYPSHLFPPIQSIHSRASPEAEKR